MNFSFETQGTNTYLIYIIGQDDTLDTMSLGMITNNKISGLASTIFTQMDESKFIKYNVSAKVPVSQFFAGAVNKKRLLGVFKGIVNAMLSAEEYMIDANSIVMDLDYIFADVSTCETVLVCVPVIDTATEPVDLKAFFKNIIFTKQFDQTENCDYIAKLLNYLNSVPVLSLEDFKAVLDSIDNLEQVVSNQSVVQSAPVQQPVVSKPVQPAVTPQPAPIAKPNPVQQPIAPPPVQTTVAIPTKQSSPVIKNTTSTAEPVEKMSMFYLLQHYNKENAAVYKAQKEAKKKEGAISTPVVDKKTSKKQDKKKPTSQSTPNTAFAVPGKSAPSSQGQNFAIPGKPAPSSQSFAIPGQPAQTVDSKLSSSIPVQNVQAQPVTQSPVASATASQPIVSQAPVAPQTQNMNFGETTVLSKATIGETTVLNAVSSNPSEPKPHLIRAKNNEKININKPVFRIGKEKSYVDYFVNDNTAISRSHANLITRDGEFFVVDTNSTNHTFLNGAMIQSNVEAKLENGDRIRFANEEFEFKLF